MQLLVRSRVAQTQRRGFHRGVGSSRESPRVCRGSRICEGWRASHGSTVRNSKSGRRGWRSRRDETRIQRVVRSIGSVINSGSTGGCTNLGSSGRNRWRCAGRGPSTSDAERIAALERDNRELRRTNTISKQASAFLCGGDRPPTAMLVDFVAARRDEHRVDPICAALRDRATRIAVSTGRPI